MRFTVEYTFIENGRTCHTSWSGPAGSVDGAVRKSTEWFGFEKDNIEVTGIKVTDENGEVHRIR